MPAVPGSPYNTAQYRRMKAAFIAASAPVCGYEGCQELDRYIDKGLGGNHPLGPSIDHIVPTSRGGSMWDLTNWRLVHRRCNSRKGAGLSRRAVTDLTWE